MEEIHLNYTRFLDKENGRVWWPNRTLRETAFINLTTSGARHRRHQPARPPLRLPWLSITRGASAGPSAALPARK